MCFCQSSVDLLIFCSSLSRRCCLTQHISDVCVISAKTACAEAHAKFSSRSVFYSAAFCRISVVLSSCSKIQQSCSHHVNLLLLLLLSPQCAIWTQPNLSHHHCKSETGHVLLVPFLFLFHSFFFLLSFPKFSTKIASVFHRLQITAVDFSSSQHVYLKVDWM